MRRLLPLLALLAFVGCGGGTRTVTSGSPGRAIEAIEHYETSMPVPPVQAICLPSSDPRIGTACRPEGAARTALPPPSLLYNLGIGPGLDGQGAHLIEQFEGYSRCAYYDGYGGVWTVGFGQTRLPNGRPVYPGFCFTSLAAAQDNLITSVNREYLWTVREACGSACGQHQVNGLVSFDYNLGAYIFRNTPSLFAAIHRGDFRTACSIMRHYAYAGGQYLPGLARRRGLECAEIERASPPPCTAACLRAERVRKLHAQEAVLRRLRPRQRTLRRVLVADGCVRRRKAHERVGPRCARWFGQGNGIVALERDVRRLRRVLR